MSHVVTIAVKIRDLDALEAACGRLGLKLNRGQTTHKWFGHYVGDYHGEDAADKHGIKPEDFGKCEHAISVEHDIHAYEIGLVRDAAGGWRMVFDFYGREGMAMAQHVGGNGLGRLLQAYAVERARIEARRTGKSFLETAMPNGQIKVTIGMG